MSIHYVTDVTGHRAKLYIIDGQATGFLSLAREAKDHGIGSRRLRARLRRGLDTRAALFAPVRSPCVTGKRSRDAAEVAAACRALDSRPRLWTGY